MPADLGPAHDDHLELQRDLLRDLHEGSGCTVSRYVLISDPPAVKDIIKQLGAALLRMPKDLRELP
eukprot:55668-Heterocapsa_arctica.AAC.1